MAAGRSNEEDLANLATTKPLMDVPFQEVLDDLSKTLECIPSQLSPIMEDVKAQYKCTMMEILQPRLAAPMFFTDEVRFVKWERLPSETQDAVRILNDEVGGGRLPPGTIKEYVHTVIQKQYGRPPAPDVYHLNHGAMTHLCLDMQVDPPENDCRNNLLDAADRLHDHDRQFLLSQKLCPYGRG